MEGEQLQDAAREVAEELPTASISYPFGPDYEVFKVKGKVFMLLTDVPGDPIVIIKADPEESKALRESYEDITPGYHMNKTHWITLNPGGTIDQKLVQELVTDSYRLVVAGLPRARRPVDPESFGRAVRGE